MLHKYFLYILHNNKNTFVKKKILFTADNHVTGHMSSAELAPPLGINRHPNPSVFSLR